MNDAPSYEFDGYLCTPSGEKHLCDIKVWLPNGPDADGSINVVVMNQMAHASHLRGFVTLVSEEAVDAAGLRFEAKGAYIESSRSLAHRRRAGGTTVTFTHISSWTIETGGHAIKKTDEQVQEDTKSAVSIVFKLGALDYGGPKFFDTFTYQGNRTVEEIEPPKLLSMKRNNADVVCEWHLQRYWSWSKNSRSKITATSYPVLVLCDPLKRSLEISSEELMKFADDACTLLTLSARHRVCIYTSTTSVGLKSTDEWRNPLQRQRATTEEEAAGPLIAAKDLERYFAHISPWWLNLDDIKKDAVRLAIFSLNPSTDTTIESDFISRFSALEGLIKRWTPIKAKFFKQKAEALLHAFPPRIIGLWPLVDNSSGKSLYWIRNELAHGRDVMRFTNGALALANDHLQLWLEYILLAIADYPHESHWKDWLSNEVISQREMVREVSAKLEGQANGKQI